MRRYLLVGASSGIGLALASLLADGEVVNLSRTPCELSGVVNYAADVSDKEALDRALDEIVRNHPPTDLVYLAGCSMCAPFALTKEEHARKLVEVNLWGACRVLWRLLPYLKEGHVVLVGSMAGAIPIPYDPFYSATKAAMSSLALELSVEEPSVKWTAVLPGGTRTGFTAKRLVYDEEHAGDYYGRVRAAANELAYIEQNGQTPLAVAKAIRRVLHRKSPPVVCPTGPNKLTYALSRLLPAKVTKALLVKMFGPR